MLVSNAHKAHEIINSHNKGAFQWPHVPPSCLWLALTLVTAECPASWLSLCAFPGICCRAGIRLLSFPTSGCKCGGLQPTFCATSTHCLWVNLCSGYWWHHLSWIVQLLDLFSVSCLPTFHMWTINCTFENGKKKNQYLVEKWIAAWENPKAQGISVGNWTVFPKQHIRKS